MNLDCPTLRAFIETMSQGLIRIPYPAFTTLDLKDIAKGICPCLKGIGRKPRTLPKARPQKRKTDLEAEKPKPKKKKIGFFL